MLRRWLPGGGVLTAALAALLFLPDTSSAQGWRGGGIGFNTGRVGFYYGSGSPFNYGYYPGYSSGFYGWNSPYYGSTWYPRSYGSYSGYSPWATRGYGPSYSYGLNTPGFSRYSYSYGLNTPGFSRYNYPSSSFSSSYPSSFSSSPSGMPGSYAGADLTARDYYGASADRTRPDQTVLIQTRIPPNAEVWFDGTRTQSTGPEREYLSPPLEPGRDYVYNLRARWMQDGQEVVKTRDLHVRAGDQIRVDFLNETSYGSGSSAGEPGRGAAPSPSDRTLPRTPDYAPERATPATDRPLDRTAPGTDRDLDRTPGTAPTTPDTGTPPRPGSFPSGTPGTTNPDRP